MTEWRKGLPEAGPVAILPASDAFTGGKLVEWELHLRSIDEDDTIKMIIQRITSEEASAMLEIPFNPPVFTNECDKDKFEEDYFEVVDGLGNVLGTLGEQGEDYNLDCGFVLSRGIGFEIMSYAILNENLIPSIQTFLKSIDTDYRVRANPVFMDGWSSIWNIYISSDCVKTDCPDKILRLLESHKTVEK